jgi:hypothetical protein
MPLRAPWSILKGMGLAASRVSALADGASVDVRRWPIIEWSAQGIQQLELLHLESRDVAKASACSGRSTLPLRAGVSVWGGLVPQGMVGLSWQWQEVLPGVAAVADPMDVHSNLHWISSDGQRLSPLATASMFLRVIERLPWQQEALQPSPAPHRWSFVPALPQAGLHG